MDRFTLDIIEKDQELKSELIKTLSSETFQPYASSALSDRQYREFVLSSLKKPAEELSVETKSITSISIDRYGFTHPVLLIKNDFVDPMPQSEVLAKRIRKNEESIRKAIRASGRVERTPGENSGTAWIVAEKIAITNYHVIEKFSKKNSAGELILDVEQCPILDIEQYPNIKINFKSEHDSNASSRFDVIKILHIESDKNIDLAFLQLRKENQIGEILPSPIDLLEMSPQILTEKDICAIGYPSKNINYHDQGLMNRIFNSMYNVKQLSMGKIVNISPTLISHNCNTLEGNSGSVIFSLQNSKAIGIHRRGLDGNQDIIGKNFATPASVIAKNLTEAQKHLIV